MGALADQKNIYKKDGRFLYVDTEELVEHLNKHRKIKQQKNEWVGGVVPFGYDCYRGELRINEHDKKILLLILNLSLTRTKQDVFMYLRSHNIKREDGRDISRSAVYRIFEKKRMEIYLGTRYNCPIAEIGSDLHKLLLKTKS